MMNQPMPQTPPTKPTDIITYDLTTEQVRDFHLKRAEQHEEIAAKWDAVAEDPIWIKKATIQKSKDLKEQAARGGMQPSAPPSEKKIKESVLDQAELQRKNAATLRRMATHLTPGKTWSLGVKDYLDMTMDIRNDPALQPMKVDDEGPAPRITS